MKRKFIWAILFLSAITVNGQKSSFELIGGFNYSIATNQRIDFTPQFGIQTGLMINTPVINEKFSLKKGLIFISRNFNSPTEVIYTDAGFTGSVFVANDFKLNHLQVPIYLNYEVSNGINISIGGMAESLIKSKSQYFSGAYVEPLDWDSMIKINDFAYGFSGGVEYQLSKLSISATYQHQLNELSNELSSGIGSSNIQSLLLTFSYSL